MLYACISSGTGGAKIVTKNLAYDSTTLPLMRASSPCCVFPAAQQSVLNPDKRNSMILIGSNLVAGDVEGTRSQSREVLARFLPA